jgi:hypothetical protein
MNIFIMTGYANNDVCVFGWDDWDFIAILSIRHFHHVKKRAKAKKALTRLRTIANKLIRELQCKLPQYLLFEIYQKHFLFYHGGSGEY